jgi:hypothetical protein
VIIVSVKMIVDKLPPIIWIYILYVQRIFVIVN